MTGTTAHATVANHIDPPENQRRVDRLRAQKAADRDLVGTTLRWTGTFVVCAIIVACVVMFLLGYRTYTITGGSMEDTIHKGALSVARIVPVDDLQVGDVITYQPPGRGDLVTHRIVSIEPQSDGVPLFQTKGDANATVDPWTFTLDREVQVRYVFQVPYVGYVLLMFGTRLIRTILLVGLALLLTFMLFVHLWRKAGEVSEDAEQDEAGDASGEGTRAPNGTRATTGPLAALTVAGPRRRTR